MIIYFLFFFYLIILNNLQNKKKIRQENLVFVASFFIFLFFLGFRTETGGDWKPYNEIFYNYSQISDFASALRHGDYGWSFISYFFSKTYFGFSGLVFFQSFIFLFGLFFLSAHFKNPFFLILLSYPLLIVVMSMGYIRQSLALGFILIALRFLLSDKKNLSILFAIISSLFHSSFFVVNLIFIAFYVYETKLKTKLYLILNKYFIFSFFIFLFSFIILIFYSGFGSLYERAFIQYIGNFTKLTFSIDQKTNSYGVHLRLLIATIPVILYLIYFKNKKIDNLELNILFKFYVIFVIFISPFIGFTSIIVDRLIYSVFIIGCLIVNHCYEVSNNYYKKAIFYLSQIFIFFILFVFFNFSLHAKYWYPYKNIIIF